MSKNELQLIVSDAGNRLGLESISVMEEIQKMNKDNVYPLSLVRIDISEKGITDNADEMKKFADAFMKITEDAIKNFLDVESVSDLRKNIADFAKFTTNTRKIQTDQIKETVKHFTPIEAMYGTMNTMLRGKEDEINELLYESREKSIREHFQELLKEDDLTEIISMDAFTDFIKNKRKTNIFTAKGALSKGIKDAVAEALRLVVEPIKQAKELEDKKALQSKQFESYIENIVADGETQMLEANINQLVRMKEAVVELYPDIQEHCMRSIDNKISRCESNIKANKAIEEKDAVKNADGEMMAIFDEINTMSQNMTLDVESLKELGNQLRGIFPKLTFADNQERVKALGVSINQRVVDLEIQENTPVAEVEPVAEAEVILEAEYKLTAKYFISISDIEFIANVGVDANNETEAKEKFTELFRNHLNMVGLTKGK